MQTTRFVVFQVVHFLLFFFSGKYLIKFPFELIRLPQINPLNYILGRFGNAASINFVINIDIENIMSILKGPTVSSGRTLKGRLKLSYHLFKGVERFFTLYSE